jgi:hypothetical protein
MASETVFSASRETAYNSGRLPGALIRALKKEASVVVKGR